MLSRDKKKKNPTQNKPNQQNPQTKPKKPQANKKPQPNKKIKNSQTVLFKRPVLLIIFSWLKIYEILVTYASCYFFHS